MNLLDSFLSSLSSSQTRRAYRTDLRTFFSPEKTINADLVQAITHEDVRAFVRTMHNLDLAAGTQRRRLAALRSFFDWAMTEHVHERNPARHPDVKPMPPDNAPSSARSLTKLEVRDTLEAAGASDETGLRDQVIILTTLHAALRRSEIAGVEVGDIRPLGRYWILEVNYDDAEGEYVRIPDRVVDVIDNVKGQFGLTAGPLWRSMSNRNRGEPLSGDAIYTIVRQAGKTAGVGPITIDTLRRTGLRFAADGRREPLTNSGPRTVRQSCCGSTGSRPRYCRGKSPRQRGDAYRFRRIGSTPTRVTSPRRDQIRLL